MINASVQNPVNCSFYIKAPNANYANNPNYNTSWGIAENVELRRTNLNIGKGNDNTYRPHWDALSPYTAQIYNANNTTSQSVTVSKVGVYAIGVYGFYRASKREASEAYLYAGDEKVKLKFVEDDAQSTSKWGCNFARNGKYVPDSNADAGEAFEHGLYKNILYIRVDDPSTPITIGINKEKTEAGDWTCWDNFFMEYYGDVKVAEVKLAEFVNAYTDAMSEAQSYVSVKMNTDAKTALNQAISENTLDLNNTTEQALVNATNNLKAANTAANAAAAIYKSIAAINANAAVLNSNGIAAYASTLDAYNNGTLTDVTTAQAAFEAARAAQGEGGNWTSVIVNYDCSDYAGWTKVANEGNNGILDGHAFEFWAYKDDITSYFDYYQNVNGLPVGKYTVSGLMFNTQVHGKGGFRPTFGVYATSGSNTVSKAVDVDGTTANWYITDEIPVIDGTLRIGVKNLEEVLSARWCVTDEFKLTFVRELNDAEKEEIAKAEALVKANEVKTTYAGKVGGVLQHTTEAYNAVVAIIDNASATSTEINAAVSAFNASKVEPNENKYYFMYLAQNGTNTGLNLNATDGKNKNLTVTSAVSAVKIVPVTVGYNIKDVNGNNIVHDKNNVNSWGTADAFTESRGERFTATLNDNGTVTLTSAYSSKSIGANDFTDGSAVGNKSNTQWFVVEAATATMSCTAGKFGTFCAPFDVVLPGDVKAYSAAVEGDYVKLTQIKEASETLTAGTPAIIYSEAGLEATTLFGKATVEDATCTYGVLTGILTEAGKEVPANAYVLNTNNGVQGFYKVSTAANGVLNRCYLNAPAAAKGGLSIVFDDDNTTAVAGVSEAKAKPAVMKYMKKGQLIIETLNGKVNAAGAQVK